MHNSHFNLVFLTAHVVLSLMFWGITLYHTSIFGQSVGMPGPWLFFHHLRSSWSLMDISVWWSSLYTAFTLTETQSYICHDAKTFAPHKYPVLRRLLTSHCW